MKVDKIYKSKNVVYLKECRVCDKQYTCRTLRKKNIVLKQALKQKQFHKHFLAKNHVGIEDWVITIFDYAENEEKRVILDVQIEKKNAPYGHNER